MNHLQPFHARDFVSLPAAEIDGWRLKRYAILVEGRKFDQRIASAALNAAIDRLPEAGSLGDEAGNHGVGFQIVHFAQVAVVSPVFYWQWGTVLASIPQMRAPWHDPLNFDTGVTEVVGCVWEMEIVKFEIDAWSNTLLGTTGTSQERLASYLERQLLETNAVVKSSTDLRSTA